MSSTHYEVLDVSPLAERADIKLAWSRAVRKYHPDLGGPEADSKKFQAVQEAWKVLEDEDSRTEYDRNLVRERTAAKVSPSPSPVPAPPVQTRAPERKPKPSAKPGSSSNDPVTKDTARSTRSSSAQDEKVRVAKKSQNRIPTTIGDFMAETKAHVKEAVVPVHKVEKPSWKSKLPASMTVRYTPTFSTKWGPALTMLLATMPVFLGWLLISKRSESIELAIAGGLTPIIVIAALVVFIVGFIATALSAGWFKSAFLFGLLTVPSIVSEGNQRWVAVLALVFGAVTLALTQRAVSTPGKSNIPDYLPTVNKKTIRDHAAWGRLPTYVPPAEKLALRRALESVESVNQALLNLRTTYNVRTPLLSPDKIEESYDLGRTPIVTVAGDKVALINVLVVPPSSVAVDSNYEVWLDGQTPTSIYLKPYVDAMHLWQKHLGSSAEVKSYVIVTSDGSVEIDRHPDDIEIVAEALAESELGEFLSGNFTDVNYDVLMSIIPFTEPDAS